MQPSMDEWRNLYEAAIAFRDAAPWQWMWDSDQFGVQDPESGQIAYGCVMGRLGEHFALAAYLGSDGLAGLWEMRMGGPPQSREPVDTLLLQNCLMASFEDRTLLHKRDLDVIKALGLKFRGRNVWPWFRGYQPGYEPWFLTAPEARFLTVCLQQALDVAGRFAENPDLLPEPKPQGPYLVRVPERRGDEWVWKDTLQKPAPVSRTEAPAVPPLDAARLQRLRELPGSRGVAEMDYFYMPTPVKGEEEERPYFPQLILAADKGSGMILGMEMVKPGEAPGALAEQLLRLVEQMGMRPARVEVQREEALTVLRPVGERLGVRIIRARQLPALAAARRELTSSLAFR